MFLICTLLVSCSNNEAANSETGSTEPKIIYEEPLQETPEPQGSAGTDDAGLDNSGVQDNPEVQSSPDAADTVGVDLSGVSDMLAFAQVVIILETPEDYLGETMKIRGNYYPVFFESTQQYHHLLIVGDETQCCQSGIEFMWNGEHTFPDDYPDENAEIEISGVFASYEIPDRTLYYLIVDDITIIER